MIIYKITNKLTGNCYVGQTIRPIEERWKEHCSAKSQCLRIKNAVQKYGKNSFSIETIGTYDNLEDLNLAEQYFISFHNCVSPNGYNLDNGGTGSGRASEETKIKMSKSQKGRSAPNKGISPSKATRLKMSESQRGRKHSKETLVKMSESQKGDKSFMFGKSISKETKIKISKKLQGNKHLLGKLHSEKTREKISKALMGNIPKNRKKVINVSTGTVYDSATPAAKELGVDKTSILGVCKGKFRTIKGFIFKFI